MKLILTIDLTPYVRKKPTIISTHNQDQKDRDILPSVSLGHYVFEIHCILTRKLNFQWEDLMCIWASQKLAVEADLHTSRCSRRT